MFAIGRPVQTIRALPRGTWRSLEATASLTRMPLRHFSNFPIKKVDKFSQKNSGTDSFNRFTPDRPFKFDQKNQLMLYVFTDGHPERTIYGMMAAMGLCAYQIGYRWELSGFWLNALAAICVVPVTVMTFMGLYKMNRTIRYIKINREGTILTYETFISFGRTRQVPIHSILNYTTISQNVDGMNEDMPLTPEEVAENKMTGAEHEHTFTFDKGTKATFMTFEKPERAYVADADLLRAVLNGREVDFSNSG
jgi:hypothetical protein